MRTIEFRGSSNVKSAKLGDDGILEVTFQTGDTARFDNFTDAAMTEWEKSESAGRWFHNNVRMKPKEFPQLGGTAKASTPPGVPSPAPADNETASTRATTQPLPTTKPPAPVPALNGKKPTQVLDVQCTDRVRSVARSMYEAYLANSDGLNYEGKPCPKWEELTPAVRSHWCAAALEASVLLESPLTAEIEELKRAKAAPSPQRPTRGDAGGASYRPWRSR